MKKILMILIIAVAIIACDDGTKKETPSVPTPKTITQANGLAFDGTVTISTSDLYLNADWDAVVASVITAFNAAYEAASGPSKGRFENVFANNANAQIVLVKNLANNWEVKDGEFKTLYLKTSSIATATYGNAVQLMASNSPSVGKATPPKNRAFLG
jgi:serine protease inhibitor